MSYKILVHSQYIKDLSFENPLAPKSLMINSAPPALNVNVNIDVVKVENSNYEIALKIYAEAATDEHKVFIIELLYCGFFEIQNASDEEIKEITLIECPTILFPFARNVIANTTREAGLPPLMINPINFQEMYNQNYPEK